MGISFFLRMMIIASGFVCLPDVTSGGEREAEKTTTPDPLNGQQDLAGAAGQVLIQKLLNTNSCSSAFYELWRRNKPDKDDGYQSFLEDHYDLEVIPCPQGKEKSPIYVVLYGFEGKYSLQEDYEIPNPSQLFPRSGGQGQERNETVAIEAFTSDGKRIEPFGGNNCLEESAIMADINGDVFVERADHTSYYVEDVKSVDVLHICVVAPEPQHLLSVLYNWGEDEWSYQFTDPDKDGILHVELGPKVPGGIKPKIVYTWDKDKKAYSGPDGKTGDHFRRLDVVEAVIFKEFERLKKAKLAFPKDPDFVDEHSTQDDPWGKRGQKKPSPKDLSKPYQYASLKGLSNEDIVSYMGYGKNMSELLWESAIQTHIPTNFWTLDPKSAAFATADENRYPDHQKCFRLALDDRDGQKPPDICSISFTYVSDKSYNSIDCHYFLRVDPKRSYLACAGSWAGGMVFYNVIHDQPAFDFRLCEMPYEEARHFAQTVWWLNRVRSLSVVPQEGIPIMGSTADGSGSLSIRKDDGTVVVKLNGTIWSGHVAERWRDSFTPEVCLNLNSFLIARALPNHLGDRWSRFEPKHSQDILARQSSAPRYEQDEMKNIETLTEAFLDLYSPNQTTISFPIVRESARAAGGFVYTNLSSKLAQIQGQLPTTTPKRSEAEIKAEMKQLDAIKPNDKGWRNAMTRHTALRKELMALYDDTGADDVQALRDSITLSQKKLQCAGDPQALQDWASSKEPGRQWALQYLKYKDRKRYVATLEWWMKNTNEAWARQAFDAIAAEDSERAKEIAKGIPPDKKGDLTVSAFAHLAEANDISDEQKRIKALIEVALDPKSGTEERGKAIELLVPPDQPLRYPTKDIDAALVKLLSPKLADDVVNFTLGCACRGLARRGKIEYFNKLEEVLKSSKDDVLYDDILGPLTQLAQCNPAKYNPRLKAILQPQMKQTNKRMTDLLMAVWSADLRELKPDLERIATSSPDDYEDERAHSCGGEVSAVEGRFHLARKILSLWNEEDTMTRCRLLLAFGFNDTFEFVEEPVPERLVRMKFELAKTAQILTREQLKEVSDFLQWYQVAHLSKVNDETYRKFNVRFDALVRDALKLQ